MPEEIWNNVQKVRIAFKPNQKTDNPILAVPSNSVDIYTNILPNQPPTMAQAQHVQPIQSASLLPLQTLTSSPLITPQALVGPYPTHPYHYQPGIFNNNSSANNINPLLFNNPSNYLNVMAAAQSILNNAAAYYNSMLIPTTVTQQQAQHQRILSPQPTPNTHQQLLLSPMLQPTTQTHQISPYHSPQVTHKQIKRKPVQLQQQQPHPPQILSTQIDQRLNRKKNGQYNDGLHSDQKNQFPGPYPYQHDTSLDRRILQQSTNKPPHNGPPSSFDLEHLQRQLQQQHITRTAKKRVRFVEHPTTYVYEQEESEDDNYGEAVDDNNDSENDNHDMYYYDNQHDGEEEEAFEYEYPPYYNSKEYDYNLPYNDEMLYTTTDRDRPVNLQQQQQQMRIRDDYSNASNYTNTHDYTNDSEAISRSTNDADYQTQPLFNNKGQGRNVGAIYKKAPFWKRKNT